MASVRRAGVKVAAEVRLLAARFAGIFAVPKSMLSS